MSGTDFTNGLPGVSDITTTQMDGLTTDFPPPGTGVVNEANQFGDMFGIDPRESAGEIAENLGPQFPNLTTDEITSIVEETATDMFFGGDESLVGPFGAANNFDAAEENQDLLDILNAANQDAEGSGGGSNNTDNNPTEPDNSDTDDDSGSPEDDSSAPEGDGSTDDNDANPDGDAAIPDDGGVDNMSPSQIEDLRMRFGGDPDQIGGNEGPSQSGDAGDGTRGDGGGGADGGGADGGPSGGADGGGGAGSGGSNGGPSGGSGRFNNLLNNLLDLFGFLDPLVLDLDGDGIELTSIEDSNAFFDLDGDGFAERTAFVAPDDGLLAIDRNENGRIDDISELFGSAAETGYEELAESDSNSDGRIDAQDADFESLLVFQDVNGNGVSDAGELRSLSEAGITSISLDTTAVGEIVNGNVLVETTDITFEDGSVTQSGEVLFQLSQSESQFILPEGFEYDPEAFSLPFLFGAGEIPDTAIAFSLRPELQDEAREIIGTLRSGNLSSTDALFEDFLFEWAGVSDAQYLNTLDNYTIHFLFDADDFADGNVPSDPDVSTYYITQEDLSTNSDARAEIIRFAEENGLFFADEDALTDSETYEFDTSLKVTDNSFQFTTFRRNPDAILEGSSLGSSSLDIPTISAQRAAFIQEITGQDIRPASNLSTLEDVLFFSNGDGNSRRLNEGFEALEDYFAARFFVQAPDAIIAAEGPDADLGVLEAFQSLNIDPATDRILGDAREFTKTLVQSVRDSENGTDAEALELLALFDNDLPSLAEFAIVEFPDIDRALVSSILGEVSIITGTDEADTLIGGRGDFVAGDDGDDVIQIDGSTVYAGQGDDVIEGGDGGNTYLYFIGDGNDTITNNGASSTLDSIIFGEGITLNDLTVEYVGDDLLISLNDLGGSITITDYADDSSLAGRNQIDRFDFADGISLGRQEFLAQVLGTDGDDVFNGTGTSDTYTFRGGEGDDQITSVSNNFGETDRIRFDQGITLDDITVEYVGDDLRIIHNTLGGSITVIDYAIDSSLTGRNQVERFDFDDGTSLTRQEFLAQALGTDGDDIFNGSGTSDSFGFRGGEGDDRIVSSSSNHLEVDRISFGEDVSIDDITAEYVGDDLRISHNTLGGVVTLTALL